MTTRRFLDAYRSIVQEINSLEVAVARCQRDGTPNGIHSLHIERAPTTNNRDAAALQLYDGLSAQLNAKRAQLERMNSRFRSIIQAAPNPQIAMIMTYYYGMGDQDQTIAATVGYTREYINRLRNEYIKQLDQHPQS